MKPSLPPRMTQFLRLPSSAGYLPYVLTAFRVQNPVSVDIELSNRCNLRCKMCWFHGENGRGDLYRGQELTTREVFSLVDGLAACKPSIYIGGSEPLVRSDFLDIVGHIKKRNLSVSFTTNGTLFDHETIHALVLLGVDTINFSIDGPEKEHDEVRGQGVYRKVTSAVRELSTYRKLKSSSRPVIAVNITITSKIVGKLEQALEEVMEATDDGADFYRFHHLWYVTGDELAEHRALVQRTLGCNAPGAAGHLLPVSASIDPAGIAEELAPLRGRDKVRMFPGMSTEETIAYYSSGRKIKERCTAPYFTALIKPNGDVKFCPDEWIDDYVPGNVRMQAFEEIWNNEKSRRFRKVLWKQKSFPSCKRCSWMYSF